MFSALRTRLTGLPQPQRVETSKLGEQQVFEPGRLIDLYQFNCRYEVYNDPSASYARNKRLAVCNASLPNELKGKLERIIEANPQLSEKLTKVINLSMEMKNLIRFYLTKGSCGGMVSTLKGDRSVDIKIRFVQSSQDYEIMIYFERFDFNFEDIEIISTVTPFVSNKQLKVIRERILRKRDEGIERYRENRREFVLEILENVILENPISRTKTMTSQEQRMMRNTLSNKLKLKTERNKYVSFLTQSLQKNFQNIQINTNITIQEVEDLLKLTNDEKEIFFFICYNEYIIYSHQKNKTLTVNQLTETGSRYSIEHMVCDLSKVLSIQSITKTRKILFKTSITSIENISKIIENVEKIQEELNKYLNNRTKMIVIKVYVNEVFNHLKILKEKLLSNNIFNKDKELLKIKLGEIIELFKNNIDLRRIFIENYIIEEGKINQRKGEEVLNSIILLSEEILQKMKVPNQKKRKMNEITPTTNIHEESTENHIKNILNIENLKIQQSIQEEYERKLQELIKNINEYKDYFVSRMRQIYQIFGENIQYQIDENNNMSIYKNFIRIMVLTLNNPKVKYLLDHVLYKDLIYDTFYSSFKKEILESSFYEQGTENISFYDLNIDLISDEDSRLVDHIYMFSDYFEYHPGLNNYFDILFNNILYSFSEEGLRKKELNMNIDIQNQKIEYNMNIPSLNDMKESVINTMKQKIESDNHYLIRIFRLVPLDKQNIQFLMDEFNKNENPLKEDFKQMLKEQQWGNQTSNKIKELEIKNFLQTHESNLNEYPQLKDLLIYMINESKILNTFIEQIFGQQKKTTPTNYSFNFFYFFNNYYQKICETNGFDLFYVDLMYLMQQYFKDENLYQDLDYFMLFTFILSKVDTVNHDHIFYKKSTKNNSSPYPTGSARRFTDCVRNNTYFMNTTFSFGKINILETFIFQAYKQDNDFFDISYNYILKFIKNEEIRTYINSLIFDEHKGLLSDGLYIKLKIKRLRELFNEFINQYFIQKFTNNCLNDIYTQKIDTHIIKIPNVFNIAGYPYLFTLTNNTYEDIKQPYRLMFENIYQFIQDNKTNAGSSVNIFMKNVLYLIQLSIVKRLKLENRLEENKNYQNIYETNFRNKNNNDMTKIYENYLQLFLNINPSNPLFKDFCEFIIQQKNIKLGNKRYQDEFKYFSDIGLLNNIEDTKEICELYLQFLKRPSFNHYQISSFFGYFAQMLRDLPINRFLNKKNTILLSEVYEINYQPPESFMNEEKYQSYENIYKPIQEKIQQVKESLQTQRKEIQDERNEIIRLEGIVRQASTNLGVIFTNKNQKLREYKTMLNKAKTISTHVLKNSRMSNVIQISEEILENSPQKFIDSMEEKYRTPPERRMILRKDPYYQNPQFREFIDEFKRRTEEVNAIRKAENKNRLIQNKRSNIEERKRVLKQKEDELQEFIQIQKQQLIPIRQQLGIRNINNINDIDKMIQKIEQKLSIMKNKIDVLVKEREFFEEKKKIIDMVRNMFDSIIQNQPIMENHQIQFILENLPMINKKYVVSYQIKNISRQKQVKRPFIFQQPSSYYLYSDLNSELTPVMGGKKNSKKIIKKRNLHQKMVKRKSK